MSRIDSIILVAKSYLGTREGSEAHQEIIDLYNEARYSDAYQMTMNDPWCCAFVVAVFQKCGMGDIIPGYAYCDGMINVFKQWGRWKKRGDTVVEGDIIFYDWEGNGSSDHVGIVVQNQFGDLSVIEGNKSDSVSYRTINRGSSQIIGYGSPNYDAHSGSNSTPVDTTSRIDKEYIRTLPLLQKGCKSVYVKILQVMLNYYNKAELEVDGEFGSLTKDAVTKYQEKYKLEVDGVVGTETWTHLLTKA